jgi:glycosyltransferase involved in cell wall biosynthesis
MKNYQNQYTFAVLLPVHRDDQFLVESIESILLGVPNNCNLYIIVHNNKQLYFKLVENYRNPNIQIFNDERSRNLAEVLNFGILNIKENYIFRMDSDDVCLTNRYENQIQYMKSNPTCSLVASGIQVENSVTGKTYNVSEERSLEITTLSLIKGCPIAHPTVLYNKNAIISMGAYDPKIKYAEDYELWLRLVQNHKITVTPDIVLKYRYHEKSQSKIYLQEQKTESEHIKFNAVLLYLGIPGCRKNHQINQSIGCKLRFKMVKLVVACLDVFARKNFDDAATRTMAEIKNLLVQWLEKG